MMVWSHGYGTLVRDPIAVIEEWFGLSIPPLIRNMEVDTVLDLVIRAHVAEADWAKLPYQE